jgi:hypothetical protein
MEQMVPIRLALAAMILPALLLVGCQAAAATPSPAASAAMASPTATLPSTTPATPSPAGTPRVTATPEATPSPTPASSHAVALLDGLLADPLMASRLPLAIMIDDNVIARPQAGFNAASIVYQAPADGGEDRYMLIFQERDAERVGPVRSGRPYFVRWAAEYRAAFGHYGGDAKTLAYIPTLDRKLIYDVDALAGASAAYQRDANRPRPHNAYTSTDRFRSVAERRGAPSTVVDGLASRPFDDDLPADLRPTNGTITVPYHRGAAGYAYDPSSNAYLRSVAGKPHIDELDGKRVVARNVVVLFMRQSVDPESEPGYRRPVLDQIGTGKAIVFRDGLVFEGTWKKRDEGDLTRFYDSAGKEITLVRGRIFIQVVATGTKVTWSTE